MNLTVVNGAQQAILAGLIAADAMLDGALLKLFQNNLTINKTIVIGDITAADYTGYAPEEVTWLTPSFSTSDGTWETIGIAGEFRPSGTTVANQIYGAYLTTAAGALIAVGRLDDAPEPFDNTSNSLVLTPRVRLDPLGVPVVEVT